MSSTPKKTPKKHDCGAELTCVAEMEIASAITPEIRTTVVAYICKKCLGHAYHNGKVMEHRKGGEPPTYKGCPDAIKKAINQCVGALKTGA